MSNSISVGRPMAPPSLSRSDQRLGEVQQDRQQDLRQLHNETRLKMNQGKDARSAPISPARTVPVIDRSKVNPEVLQAAEGMETMFLDYMMKVMRETVPKNEMDLESPATGIYRGMMDSEFAQKAAHQGGVGLADQVIAYMESRGYNGNVGMPHGQPMAAVKKEKP